MNDDVLLIQRHGAVAVLTLNRPDALNALNAALRTALVAALGELQADDAVAVIVLTGRGRAFCAGLDVKELRASQRTVADNVGGGDIGAALAGLRKPVVAAINGLAVTGGFEIALACDIVLAAESAWFQDTHARIGLLPGWGLSQRLPRVAGLYRAKEISLTARKVSAREAAELGFVSRVVEDELLLEAAIEIAGQIAQWPADHVARMKALMDDGFGMHFAEALRFEASEAAALNRKVTIKAP